MRNKQKNYGLICAALYLVSAFVYANTNSPSFGDVAGNVNIFYGNNANQQKKYAELDWAPKLDEMSYEERKVTKTISGLLSDREMHKAEKVLDLFRPTTNEGQIYLSRYKTTIYFWRKDYKAALLSVLERYNGLPLSDVRFRYDLAYIIYHMRFDRGVKYAEEIISSLRKTNPRRDLSYVWMGIHPTPLVRLIKKDLYPYQELHQKQKEILRYVLATYPDDKFIDHAYYLLHMYDKIITHIPDSMILEESYYAKVYRDHTLKLKWPVSDTQIEETLSVIDKRNMREQISAIQPIAHEVMNEYHDFIDHFQNGSFLVSAFKGLLDASLYLSEESEKIEAINGAYNKYKALEKNSLSKALAQLVMEEMLEHTQKFLIDLNHTRINVVLKQLPEEIASRTDLNLIHSRIARSLFNNRDHMTSLVVYKKINAEWNGYYKDEKLRVEKLKEIALILLKSNDNGMQNKDFLFKIAMALKGTKHDAIHAIPYLNEYMRISNKTEYAKIEMLKAFCFRDSYNGKLMVESYNRIINDYPDSEFADDALAEIGVYHLLWEGDAKKAISTFDKVISKYPNGNAVDNALNWKAYAQMKNGDYVAAYNTLVRLIKKEPLSRFAKYAFSNIAKISLIKKSGTEPLIRYLEATGKQAEAGHAKFNGKTIVFYMTRSGNFNKLDINLDEAAKITEFNFSTEHDYITFQADDFKYKTRYAWGLVDNKLSYAALRKTSNSIQRSGNYDMSIDDEKTRFLNNIEKH